jgi:hypothetical protein
MSLIIIKAVIVACAIGITGLATLGTWLRRVQG